MKNIFIAILLTLVGFTQVHSQGMAVNASNTPPHSSAMLDVSSTTKGMLVPRMNSTQRTSLVNPATGLLVYDNTTNSFWYWAGSWKEISAGGDISGKASGDLDGAYPGPSVVGLLGRGIDQTPANNMQILKWNQGTSKYQFGNDSLFLPYQGSTASAIPSFAITNTQVGLAGSAILGRRLAGSGTIVSPSGVWGDNSSGIGVSGTSGSSFGVYGISTSSHGVHGLATGTSTAGVYGKQTGPGSTITPSISMGVWGDNSNGVGVVGTSDIGVGTYGVSMQNHGVSGYAVANAYAGIYGTHANNGPGVMGESQSSGMGIYGKSTGTGGMAGKFETTNASNALPVIMATTTGTGSGLYVGSTNTGLAGPGIEVLTQGTGDGITVTTNKGKSAVFAVADAASTNEALKVSNYGDGSAAILNSLKSTSTSSALKVYQYGLGHGAEIVMPINNNSSAGLNVSHAGEGSSAIFNNTKADAVAASLKVNQASLGMGVDIALTNSASSTPGINVTNQGEGNAAFFSNTKASATAPSVKVNQLSIGRGIEVNLTNASNTAAGINVTSAGSRGITVDAQGASGIYAISFANNGIGIEGRNNGNNGVGVRGLTYVNAANPVGVLGENSSGSTYGVGVKGKAATNDTKGIGVYGTNFTSEQDRGAITGENQASGVGVYGRSLFTGYGVMGLSTVSYNQAGAAVYGYNSNGGTAIKALSEGALATGITALADPSSGFGTGVVGQSWGNGDGVRGFGGGYGSGITGIADNNTSSSGIYGTDNSGATLGKAAKFEIGNSGNTSEAVNISNAGLGRSLYIQQTNASNTQAMLQFRKYGTSDYVVFRDGSNVAKIRFDNTGKGFFNGGTQVGGADMAELFETEDNISSYEPGDVLVISTQKDRTVVRSDGPYSNLVAGVFATKPGMLMGEDPIDSDKGDKLPMGVVGVIPTKVCNEGGAIHRGDLLVTSSIPGVAMKADPAKLKMGQVLGKALENYNAGAVAKIRVLVNVK